MGIFLRSRNLSETAQLFHTALQQVDPTKAAAFSSAANVLVQQNQSSNNRFETRRFVFACVLLALLLIGYLVTAPRDTYAELSTVLISTFSSVLSITIGILIGEASQS
jgi:hypothetical protein